MWSRTRLDIGWSDLAFGLRKCLFPPDQEKVEREIERVWSSQDDTIVCFSVRSGFDLALQALDLPAGSEVLFSALNVKGMIKIARRIQLVPIPVDLNLDTMLPDLDSLERAITPESRVIVVAPLFGTRGDLGPVIDMARKYNLLVIEDCAQAFAGREFTGHDGALASMFSFGPLKYATALGGAVLRVRDPALLERMRAIQATYPVQRTRAYLKRLLKFAALKILTTRAVLGAVTRFFRMRGEDYEDSVSDAVRNVADLGSSKRIRIRCNAPMLAVLQRRLTRFRPTDFSDRIEAGRFLLEELGDTVVCPGTRNPIHNFWVFPILVDDPGTLMEGLRGQGFDGATLRRSATVAPPADRPKLTPVKARDALSKLVILPCYGGIPKSEMRRQAEVVRRIVQA
jgi:dTDP-4-amino-4,6-dideoxygalactose transaminase